MEKKPGQVVGGISVAVGGVATIAGGPIGAAFGAGFLAGQGLAILGSGLFSESREWARVGKLSQLPVVEPVRLRSFWDAQAALVASMGDEPVKGPGDLWEIFGKAAVLDQAFAALRAFVASGERLVIDARMFSESFDRMFSALEHGDLVSAARQREAAGLFTGLAEVEARLAALSLREFATSLDGSEWERMLRCVRVSSDDCQSLLDEMTRTRSLPEFERDIAEELHFSGRDGDLIAEYLSGLERCGWS